MSTDPIGFVERPPQESPRKGPELCWRCGASLPPQTEPVTVSGTYQGREYQWCGGRLHLRGAYCAPCGVVVAYRRALGEAEEPGNILRQGPDPCAGPDDPPWLSAAELRRRLDLARAAAPAVAADAP